MKFLYNISATSENAMRVLQRISGVFGRNRLNIEKLYVFETAQKGISQFDIVIKSDEKTKDRVLNQLRKVIELNDVKISNKVLVGDEEVVSGETLII